jgi:hypothetical protein
MASSSAERLAPDGRSVVVTVTPGEPETGLWCPFCLLHSLVRVQLYAVTDSGVTLMGTAEGCPGCTEDALCAGEDPDES